VTGARTHTRKLPGSLLGMLLFISSEVMFFGSLFGAYFTIRAAAPEWPPAGSPEIDVLRTALFSVLLVSSSATIQLAVNAIGRDDRPRFVRWLLVTIGLGIAFLAGQAIEYAELWSEGFGVSSNVFGTLFFTMTGFHGLHVVGGLIAMAIVGASARRGDVHGGHYGPAEAVSYYWHFVDVVWILLFSTLYLLD
jgi:heme/copper-type cytochrome/quinol oxidase subunit 3